MQEVPKFVFGDRNARRVVRILVGEVHDLQEPGISKLLYCARELDDAEIICRLQEKVDAQSRNFGLNVDSNFGKVSSLLKGLRAFFDFLVGIWRPRLLGDERNERAEIAMWICDQRDGAHILTFIGSLGSARGKLCECRRGTEQANAEDGQAHRKYPTRSEQRMFCQSLRERQRERQLKPGCCHAAGLMPLNGA